MLDSAFLIFPNQLFHHFNFAKFSKNVFLIEYSLFFGEKRYNSRFHFQKLILHRASMKAYFEHELVNLNSHYLEYSECDLSSLMNKYSNLKKVFCFEPKDFLLKKRLIKVTHSRKIDLEFVPNPNFLTPPDFYNQFFKEHKLLMTPFYIEQRKRLDVLVDRHQKPVGGKWTFDTENRKKLPKNLEVPLPKFFGSNTYVDEAIRYVRKNFPNSLGLDESFHFPISRKEALSLLQDFLDHRFLDFGPYEDSISQRNDYIYHSLLSSSINIGLLNPQEVVDLSLDFADRNKVPLNSVEGFIRQIIGWREFMMIVYELKGVSQRTSNFFNHQNKLVPSFYNGTTGIAPVDSTIMKVSRLAYAHHIERLMVMGNFMCLCEIDPNEVYSWFMEFFIDSYDWVMVPNVYGMSQYADGGLMTTKPYISSSNYILKMSDFSKGPWVEIWDGLFWRFLHKNYAKIAPNPRLSMLLKGNSYEKVKQKIKLGERFLEKNF